MILINEKFQVEIREDKTFTMQSTDNIPYDLLFNPENLSRNDSVKAFRITIESNDVRKNIVLIGSLFSYDTNCAVLEDEKLIILMDNTVTIIHLEKCKIVRHVKFSEFGCYFSIYKFQDGYIIYGQVEVVKLDEYLNKEWDFSGANIFITQDENKPFQISDNKIIKLYDWNGVYCELDMNGKLTYDTYNK